MKKSADPNSDKMQAEFRQKLENLQAAPTESLWDKIELSLDKEEALVYKNQFRTYARLAAACLAFLIAFAIVFVPQKWNRFNQPAPEIAASETAKNQETAVASNAGRSEKSVGATSEIAQTETQKATLEMDNKKANSTPETVGFEALKVQPENQAVAVTTPARSRRNPENKPVMIAATRPASGSEMMIARAETSHPITAVNEALAANGTTLKPEDQVAKTTSEPMVKTGPETALAANLSGSDQAAKTVTSEGNLPAENTLAKIISPEVIADLKENHNGTANSGNPRFGETLKPEESTLVAVNTVEIPQETSGQEETLALNEQVAIATTKIETAETEKPQPDKAAWKTRRWLLTGSYAAVHFNSGITLAGRSFQSSGNIGNANPEYQQNIAGYQTAIQAYNQETSAAYSQVSSISMGYKVARKWLVQMGLQYSKNGEKTRSSQAFVKNGSATYPGPVTANSGSNTQTTLETVLADNFNPMDTRVMPENDAVTHYSYQHFGIPVTVRFQTDGPEAYYFGAAGVSLNWLTKATISTGQENTTTIQQAQFGARQDMATSSSTPEIFRRSTQAINIQAGAGYHLGPRWQAELALTGYQFLQPLVKNEQAAGAEQQNPRCLAVALNLGFSF